MLLGSAVSVAKQLWPYGLAVIAVGGALAWSYQLGNQHASARVSAQYEQELNAIKQKHIQTLEAQAELFRTNLDLANSATLIHAKAEAALSNKYQSLAKRVHDYAQTQSVDNQCVIDADGLQIWRDANLAATSTADNHYPKSVDDAVP